MLTWIPALLSRSIIIMRRLGDDARCFNLPAEDAFRVVTEIPTRVSRSPARYERSSISRFTNEPCVTIATGCLISINTFRQSFVVSYIFPWADNGLYLSEVNLFARLILDDRVLFLKAPPPLCVQADAFRNPALSKVPKTHETGAHNNKRNFTHTLSRDFLGQSHGKSRD